MTMLLDFAVYDTQNYLAESDEEVFINEFGTTAKRYIYAYQIITKNETTTAVASFAIRDSENQLVNEALIDDEHHIDPTPYTSNENHFFLEPVDDELDNGEWSFDGFGLKDLGRSSFLVFASDSAPTRGSYEVTAATGLSIPGDVSTGATDTPEPMSILLLGSGFFAVRRRRKSVKV